MNDDCTANDNSSIPLPTENIDNTNHDKPLSPPPMFFRGVIDTVLSRKIRDICPNFTLSSVKRGKLDETKITTKDSDSYRAISKFLEERKYSFYSFQSAKNKGTAFVIKNIPHSTERGEIKVELEELGFRVNKVFSMKKPQKDSPPMDMFKIIVQCNAAEKNALLKLELLLYRKVKVELFVPSEPVRCNNCNEYGHSKNYCNMPTVCVYCSGLHATKVCKFKVKQCSNCGESHTANYRGCVVFKALKEDYKIRNNMFSRDSNKFTFHKNEFMQLPNQPSRAQPTENYKLNYRNAVVSGGEQMAKSIQNMEIPRPSTSSSNIEEALIRLTSQFDEFAKMMKNTVFTLVENLGKLINSLLAQRSFVNDK